MSESPSLMQSQSEFLLALQGGTDINNAVSHEQRLKVYAENHQNALLGVLTDTFCLTKNLLDQSFFHELCIDYIQKHPSTNENLNLYGHEFSEFLSTVNQRQLTVDVANYEYQRVKCYYANNSDEFPIEYFESMDVQLKLQQGFIKQESVMPFKACFDIEALNLYEKIIETDFKHAAVLYREMGKVKAVSISSDQYDFLIKFNKPHCLQGLSEHELVLLPNSIVKNWLKLVGLKP